ncbi:M16 peptidase-like protein [Aureococcus anophagefferens]|nr:M16 peptidase-like protein [Aureococcus anophagefferens]
MSCRAASLSARRRSRRRCAPASATPAAALRVLVAEDDMVAPPLDARRYRLVALPNGMRALLVSDPGAETSAAALDVKVGFLSDPWDRPGLAHFCEHMLFLGNAKYPAEGEWRSFLETRGGSSNAYTAAEDTCFYFDVDAGDFDAALDRFAQFFVSPTFSASGVNRELEAIESEDSKNQQSDGFRLLQLDRSARGAATEDHPARKFGTGNRATLLQRGDRSADVAENAPPGDYNSLRRALVDHYDRFYDADHMALVVLGRDPLDVLERSVARRFGDVRRGAGGDRRPAAAWAGKPALRAGLADGGLAPALLAAPVGATRRLSLSWRFPYDGPGAGAMDRCDAGRRENLRYKPGSLVSSVVGDEGAGSLLSWAKQQGYASGITSFASGDGSCDGRFDVSFELTKKGLSFWPDLVAAAVGAVAALKASGVPRYRAEELDALNELNWRFSEPARPGQLAKALLRITVVAREFLADGDFWGPLDRRERWYGTRYKEYAFDAPSIASLAALRAPPRGGVALPKPNKFLPRDLRIRFPPVAATPAVEAVDAAAPEPLGDASGWTGRYAGDRYFNRPRAIVFAGARVLSVVEDPTSAMLGKIWRLSALDSLQERLWPARVAGLQYSLEVGGRGVSLSFSGYADGLGALARDTKFKPYETTGLASTLALTKDQPSDAQLLAALDGLASDGGAALVDRVRRFSRERLWAGGGAVDAAGADVLVEGNFDRAEAAALFRTATFFDTLRTKEQLGATRRRRSSRRLAAFVDDEATAAVARLDDAGLASVVAGLVAAKLEPDRRLFDQTGRHWEEIRRCRDAAVEGRALAPDWVRRYEAAETLKSLTAAEVRDHWTSTVRPGAAGTFGVEVYGRRAAPEPPREGQLVARSPLEARRFLAPLDLPVS